MDSRIRLWRAMAPTTQSEYKAISEVPNPSGGVLKRA